MADGRNPRFRYMLGSIAVVKKPIYAYINNKYYFFSAYNYMSSSTDKDRTVNILDKDMEKVTSFDYPKISIINNCSGSSYCDEFYVIKVDNINEENKYIVYIKDYYEDKYYKLTFNYDNTLINQENVEFNETNLNEFLNSTDEENYICNSKFCLLLDSISLGKLTVKDIDGKTIGYVEGMKYIYMELI